MKINKMNFLNIDASIIAHKFQIEEQVNWPYSVCYSKYHIYYNDEVDFASTRTTLRKTY